MKSILASDMSQAIHVLLEEAFQKHWKMALSRAEVQSDHLRGLMDRHLNEVLEHLILGSSEFQGFYPFPVKVRVVLKDEFLAWGFLQVGDDDALDWIKTARAGSFDHHFPPERWIKSSLPRVSRNEILLALARVTSECRQPGEDTLGALLRTGVYDHLGDRKIVALARLIDSSGV